MILDRIQPKKKKKKTKPGVAMLILEKVDVKARSISRS